MTKFRDRYLMNLNQKITIFCPNISDCPRVCTGLYRPVCGSDGKTYGNHCTLKQATCTTANDQLTVAHEGICPGIYYRISD